MLINHLHFHYQMYKENEKIFEIILKNDEEKNSFFNLKLLLY